MSRRREIPWLRIGAEGAAIVASILLAFAIDAWWQARGERVREQAMLTEIRAEFAESAVIIGKLLDDHRDRANSFLRLHDLLQSGEAERDADEIREYSQKLWTTGSFHPDMPVYNNLVDSTGLDVVSDAAIRRALRIYESAAVRNREWDEFQSAIDYGIGMEVLLSRVPAPARRPGDSEISAASGPEVAELATDLEFRNLVAVRRDGERLLVERRSKLLEAAQAVLAAIDDSS